jgi:cytochrome P450
LLERSMRDGLDLRKLKYFPAELRMPFQRDGVDPVPALASTRESAPVTKLATMFGRGIWLVSGYDAARAVLGDRTAYSNDLGQFVSQEGRSDADHIGGLGMTDPPLHTDLRRLLTPEFTVRRLARLQPFIEQVVAARLDAMAAAGPEVDLVEQFAFPVPFEVICELLGLPVEDRAHFRSLGAARFDLAGGGAGAFSAAGKTREFLIDAVARQRREPGPGLIGSLVTDHPELPDVVLGGVADGVFLGGYETSASMLALGGYLLCSNPDAMRLLSDDPDPGVVDRVVEELLRHLTVVQVAFLRFARHDLELDGQQVRAGDVIGVSLLGANHDPALTPDADRFDPARPVSRHLAFGHGVHRCVGAELARMELRVALRELARRFPDLALATPREELEWRQLSAVYAVEALPVRLHPVHAAI